MSTERAEPAVFVILGGTGDLSRRKLLPALGRLQEAGQLRDCHLVGVSRDHSMTDEAFRAIALESMTASGVSAEAARELCQERLHYQCLGQQDEADFSALGARIEALEAAHDLPGNRVFYLALPAPAVEPAAIAIGEAGLKGRRGWSRLVVEKPLGTDLQSAAALVESMHRHHSEEEIYRIDHYLGKETVQNLLAFRLGNPIFESLWNRDRIHSVQISVSESLGVGRRAGFYEGVGAIRDMVQNHMTQLMCLIAMEAPPVITAEAVRYEKIKVLRSVAPILRSDAVLGRYEAGRVNGEQVRGYLEEPGVPAGSTTETFAALRLYIKNWRWQGVPFFLRTGKRMPRRLTRIGVRFREAPVCMFDSDGVCTVEPNLLLLTLQPEEGFSLHIGVKHPGTTSSLAQIPLTFRYSDFFPEMADAYQTLLLDVLTGDKTLFVHADEVLESWKIYQPMLDRPPALASYPAGSRGPQEAESLAIPERDLFETFAPDGLCIEDEP